MTAVAVGQEVDAPPGMAATPAPAATPPAAPKPTPVPVGGIVDAPPGMNAAPAPAAPPTAPASGVPIGGVVDAVPGATAPPKGNLGAELKAHPTAEKLFDALAPYGLAPGDVTSVVSGPHVKGSAHFDGRAIDVGTIGGSPVGDNPRTIAFAIDAIQHANLQALGSIPAVIGNPLVVAAAKAANVRLFEDEGTGPHLHMQVAPGYGGAGTMPAPKEAGIALPHGTANTLVGAHSIAREAITSAGNEWRKLGSFGAGAMRYLDTILGAPQRFIAGAANEAARLDPNMPAGAINPAHVGAEAMHGFDVMFHPLDDAKQAREQDALADRILTHFGISTRDAGVKRAVELLAVQIATDPTTYIPIAGELQIGRRVLEALKAAKDVVPGGHAVAGLIDRLGKASEAISRTQLVQHVANITRARHELDPLVDRIGKAARLSLEEKYAGMMAPVRAMHADLLRQFPELKKVQDFAQLSPAAQRAVRHATDFDTWAFGSQQMRRDAVAAGFVPTDAELKAFPKPLGVLDYKYRHDYQPLLRVQPAGPRTATGLESEYARVYPKDRGQAAFEKMQNPATKPNSTLGERLERRLGLGVTYAQRRAIDSETRLFLSQHPQHFKGSTPITDDDIAKFSHEPMKAFTSSNPAVNAILDKGVPGLRVLGRIGIVGNPLPHALKNVGTLAFLSGGAPTFFRGLMHAADGNGFKSLAMKSMVPRARTPLEDFTLHDRMSRLGLMTDYGAGKLPGPFQVLQATTERLENGFRGAVLEQADKELGPSRTMADEYAKAQFVRNALGDYRNVNAIVSAFRQVGGLYTAFGLGIVPVAVGRSIARRPGRAELIERAQGDYNRETHQQARFGGPVSDFDELTNPATLEAYLTSPARIGMIGEAGRYGEAWQEGRLSPAALANSAASGAIPGYAPIVGAYQAATEYDPYAKSGRQNTGGAPAQNFPGTQIPAPWDPHGKMTPLGRALANEIGIYYAAANEAKKKKFERQAQQKENRTISRDFRGIEHVVKQLEAP